MQVIKHNDARIESFDSLYDIVRYAQSNPTPKSSDQKGMSEWAGSESLSDAIGLALNGWHEIRPSVDKLFGDVESHINNVLESKFQTFHNYSGHVVDMGRYVEGDPECMLDYVDVPQAGMGKVVRILINITASSVIDPEDIKRRGVAVVALIDTLHKMGVGMELWIEDSIRGSNDGKKHATRAKIHDSESMMDIDSLMFALAHPSMLRRIIFSVQEQSKTAKGQGANGGGYGTPTALHSTDLCADVTIERLQDGYGDIVRNPVGWVLSTVRGLGLAE